MTKFASETDNPFIVLGYERPDYFYTQFLCNQVFLLPEKNITLSRVKRVCNRILRDNDATFTQYRTLLSPIQWLLLTAIAREVYITDS